MMNDLDLRQPEALARRDFVKKLAATAAATWSLGEPRLRAVEAPVQPRATADACILLWMAGGMAAPDTFDPKRYVPFKVGTPVKDILSTFPAIDTKVDNIKICQGLENIGSVMDRAWDCGKRRSGRAR